MGVRVVVGAMGFLLPCGQSAAQSFSIDGIEVQSQNIAQAVFDFIVYLFSNGPTISNLIFGAILLIVSIFGLKGITKFVQRVVRWLGGERAEYSGTRLFQQSTEKLPGHELMVLGAQGAGKSSVIEMLSNGAVGRPSEETVGFRPFSFVACHGVADRTASQSLLISGADFQGQNFGTLTSGHVQLSRRNPASAIIVVVDVSPSPNKPDMPRSIISEIDMKRVELHLDRLAVSTVEAIGGLLDKEALKLVVLFVNAIDTVQKYRTSFLLGELSQTHRHEIRGKFSVIEDRLQEFGGGIQYKVIVGSAHSEITKKELLGMLKENAIIGGAG